MVQKEDEFSFVRFVESVVDCVKVVGEKEGTSFLSKGFVDPTVEFALVFTFEGFLKETSKLPNNFLDGAVNFFDLWYWIQTFGLYSD